MPACLEDSKGMLRQNPVDVCDQQARLLGGPRNEGDSLVARIPTGESGKVWGTTAVAVKKSKSGLEKVNLPVVIFSH
mgnify:CR=1 FL=1